MTKFLKENWFVGVIAAFFLVIFIVFAVNTAKDTVPSKSVDGKDVVFSIDDTNFTADEYYDLLSTSAGQQQLFLKFYEGVLDYAVPNTTELLSQVASNLTSTVSYYQTNYGYGIDYLNQLAQYYYGYPTFEEYILYSLKAETVYAEYIDENIDSILTDEFVSKHNPRTISYTLIKMDDPSNPTEDDLNRLKAAQDAWNSSEYNVDNFADFAKKFSEDSSTAEDGGVLGYVDDNSSLVDAFLNAALALNAGEVSEWVFDENYGYFLIKCDSTSYEDFKGDANFTSTVLSENADLANQIIWDWANKAGVSIEDEELKTYIMSQLNVTESAGE